MMIDRRSWKLDMQWLPKLKWALVALLVIAPVAGNAISISDTITLPPNPATYPVTVDLSDPPPVLDRWRRLSPRFPGDPREDYTDSVVGAFTGNGAGTASDAWTFDVTFEVTWNGTIREEAPNSEVGEEMLFAIIDSRFGIGETLDTTVNLRRSGFVPGTFRVDGVLVTPEIVQDSTTLGNGFVGNCTDQVEGCDTWIGFYLPAVADQTYTLTMRWALGQTPDMPTGNEDVFFPNALFLPVPEPGLLALLCGAGLALATSRRRA